MAKKSVVFLDRDGVINVDYGYVTAPSDVTLIEGVCEALALLKTNGFYLVVTSNQSAIGRGMGTQQEVEAVFSRVVQELIKRNPQALLDKIYYCPHLPDDGCCCRKPKPGMVAEITGNPEFDILSSWMVGDKLSDLEFGRNIGVPPQHCLLVLTGQGQNALEKSKARGGDLPRHFPDLLQAAHHIVKTILV